ncbi:MAG: hypothetical protein J5758_01980 [Abditibacteriota bacterium]|nr:hypothetical protein [Abditibacteriota bacterium]
MKPLFFLLLAVLALSAARPAAAGAYLPEPDRVIEAVICDGQDHEDLLMARVLQGVVNKTRPRVYLCCESFPAEGTDLEVLRRDILEKYGRVTLRKVKPQGSVFLYLFDRYREEFTHLYVYSQAANLADTFNAAATLAGLNSGAAVSPGMLRRLRAAGCKLPETDICEYCGFGQQDTSVTVNRWISEHLVPLCRRDMVFCLHPEGRDGGRVFFPTCYDLPVALGAAIYSVNARYGASREVQKTILDQYPPNIPVIGWDSWKREHHYVTSLSACGKLCACIDWNYDNGSVWAAFPEFSARRQTGPADGPGPEDGAVYISFMVSDGDAWHYCMKEFLLSWNGKERGTADICWTVPSLFARFNPLFLEYIYDTRTPRDEFAQGPSGMGYMYPSRFPPEYLEDFLAGTREAMAKAGLSLLNWWDLSDHNAMTGEDRELQDLFARESGADVLMLGHSSHEGAYRLRDAAAVIEEWGNFEGAGTKTAEDILKAVDAAREKGRRYVLINVEAWGERLPAVTKALKALSERPDGDRYRAIPVPEMARLMKNDPDLR